MKSLKRTSAVVILAAIIALSSTGLAQGYGTYRIGHVSFLSEPYVGYQIMSDCSIVANGNRVARVRPSYDPNFAWIYYIPSQGASYGVDNRGSVWASYAGRWQIVGHAVWTSSCF